MPLSIAIIGYGNMGSAHAAAIAHGEVPNMRLAAICDIDPDKCRAAHERHPGISVYQDANVVFHDTSIDAVLIAVPHPQHAALGIAAFQAGKHVLTEKPIDIRLSEARRLCKAARESGKVFGIMLNQRTDPVFQRAREIVQSGQVGALKRTVWIVTNWYRTQHYYDSGAWRATWAGEGGGVLLNQAPHNLDLWQWICGMPTHVRGFMQVAKYHDIEVEDDATLMTRYANGATGLFVTSTGECPGTNRLEISGTLGKLVLEDSALKWWKLEEDERAVCVSSNESFAHIPFDYQEYRPIGQREGHVGILRSFADAIMKDAPLLAPGEDGLNELALSNAAYLSQWTGNQEIDLPMGEARFDALLDEKMRGSRYLEKTTVAFKPSDAYSERWQVKW